MIKEAIGTGTTVDEAKAAAMVELGISDFDDFNVEILQMPAKKFLGIFGGNPAKVKVTVEVADPKPEKKPYNNNNNKNHKKFDNKKPQNKNEVKKQALKEKAEPKKGVTEVKKVESELPLAETNLYKETADYIKSIVLGLGMTECEIKEMSNEEEISFELDCGEDYGIIIGKHGETLDAIQYLARMMANKGNANYKRVSINVGNYRAKREETLKALAKKTAMRAIRQGRSISLEPMNPYERRIIHTAVQEVEGATSHSVGSDLDRRVVIAPADGARNNGNRGGRNNYGRRERKEAYKPEISPDRVPKSDIDGGSLYGKVEFRSAVSSTEE